MTRHTYTIESWVIEGRNSDRRRWLTLTTAESEQDARRAYGVWLVSAQRSGMVVRMLKRTAVVTDEVLEEYLSEP